MSIVKSYCSSEYSTLKTVILCEPLYMNISSGINKTQKYFINLGFNVNLAREQYSKFIDILKENRIHTLMLPPEIRFPEQVFTRDVGFTIGETVFISNMKNEVRKGEEQIFKNILLEKDITYIDCINSHIEGGDVIIDQDIIYIGVSNRTLFNSVKKLQQLLTHYKIIPVPFSKDFLHLDCVFNIISQEEALIYPYAFSNSTLKMLSDRYNLIEVSKKEQFTLATNVLSLGNEKIISLPSNTKTNTELRLRGYEVIEIDFEEIIKSGGSFRCCTLPLQRE
ncbi:dimethylarginine dimethylaminohydrolase family protein [Bacillus cereus group sp. BfR-BA-01379]|uniref:dimethylarginine dimethylaminohydrolase family protein n=1 Tax=Bacillus cereus group sp. BfR-BA-01379 TaxID=2920323 RepID=UPI001F55B72A|nr:arginine deiminase family protein [Bacillus cereus group sp. BfR-BA-01379]